MSRMEKYTDTKVKSRTYRNEKLYDQVGDISINYDYIDVNNALELNPTGDYKSNREDYQKQRELNKILKRQTPNNVKIYDDDVIPKEDRIYDINELLKNAKTETDDKPSKRLINTEYNILTKLDIKDLDKDNYRKEDLKSLINDIYEKEAPKKMTNLKRKDEDSLLKDLLDDEDSDGGLLDDLSVKEELSKDILEKNQDDLGTVPITEEIKDLDQNNDEINNKEIPESYHKEEDANEMFIFDDLKEKKKNKRKKKDKQLEIEQTMKEVASKDDGIDYDEIDKDGKGLLIAIIIVVVLIILTVLFFLYEYFFGA